MDRSGLTRWLVIGLVVFMAVTLVPKFFGSENGEHQPLQPESAKTSPTVPEKLCTIWGPRYRAVLSSNGASLKTFELVTAKYRKDDTAIDLATTPDVVSRRQLRFHFRNRAAPSKAWQTDYDNHNYKLLKTDGKSCEFEYRDKNVRLTRRIRATERPYELLVDGTIENLSDKPKTHALTVETTAWRKQSEVEAAMFRVSPFMTQVECVTDNDTTRLNPGDFEPKDFEEPEFGGKLNDGEWHQAPGKPEFAAVSNAYFSHALVPLESSKAGAPVCQTQIEERWSRDKYKSKESDPNAGAMYRARLAYNPVKLAPKQSTTYKLLTYVGPKERDLLAAVGGGDHDMREIIDLGFFSTIAKVLVAFLLKVHSWIPNWGIAIILLTIAARSLLFPLAVPSIRSAIKMREIKPEIDALNEKFKNDPQGKGLAQMELWRKHNVNPVKGCLPQMASMPVWFALYTTLQTAVELYNIPFLWFPDLSQPDPYYVLPFVIGGTSFLQQKLMPMQMEATQQKMMLYFMPAMFTVFMLFLPSGLGVYMFTNGLLTIAQQQLVERYVKRSSGAGPSGTSKDDQAEDEKKNKETKRAGAKGKRGGKSKIESRAVLGKGKA